MPIKESFYEAAVIPELWGKAVSTAREIWNTDSVSIGRFSNVCSGLVASRGAEDLAARYVLEGWYKADVGAERAIRALRKGRDIVTESDLFQPEEIQRLPFFADFLHKSGFGGFAAGLLCEIDGIVMSLLIGRRRENGAFAENDLAQIRSQLPQLRKACELASFNRLAAANGVIANLEQLGTGAFLIDWLGRVIRVNKKAEGYLETSLQLVMSRLHLSDKAANKSLQDFVTASVQPLFSGIGKPVAPLVVHRPDKRPFTLTSYPIVLQASDVFQGARAILLIKDPEEKRTISQRVLKDAFRFTPTEHRVASHLLAGLNTEEVAAELDVSKEAIRFHLKSMFAKTDTNQQAQLVSLLTRYSETV
ncbi:helix-turn-helix transcriptional regulator [Microvirga sp. P5_D2]